MYVDLDIPFDFCSHCANFVLAKIKFQSNFSSLFSWCAYTSLSMKEMRALYKPCNILYAPFSKLGPVIAWFWVYF